MPKKKQPRNAFFFFMLDYKARCERNGERFPNGMRDVQLEAGPEWDAMPASAKKPYEDMAKEEKMKIKGDDSRNLTNTLREFSVVDKERRELLEAERRMDQKIDNTINGLRNRQLLSEHKFYLIHVNYFCVTDNLSFVPAEVAVVEFCLGQGITNVYHTLFCGDGQIPLGYHHDAMQKSEATHKIPPRKGAGVVDMNAVFKSIREFLQPGMVVDGEYPPMYTMPDNVHLNTSISCAKNFMKNLCENANVYHHEDSYPIYNLEQLFFKLQRRCCELSEDSFDDAFPTITIAIMELERDIFNYTSSIGCEFHVSEDAVNHCSMSFVQRWVFLICDHCCQHLDIRLKPGRHIPLNADVEGCRPLPEEPLTTKLQGLSINKPFTMVNPSNTKSDDSWVPVVRPGPPRPTGYGIAPARQPVMPDPSLAKSEENFPSISLGRGRGKIAAAVSKPATTSFADMMKKK